MFIKTPQNLRPSDFDPLYTGGELFINLYLSDFDPLVFIYDSPWRSWTQEMFKFKTQNWKFKTSR